MRSGGKQRAAFGFLTAGWLSLFCAAVLLSAAITGFLTLRHAEREQFLLLSSVCEEVLAEGGEARTRLLAALGAQKGARLSSVGPDGVSSALTQYGFQAADFTPGGYGPVLLGFAAGAGLLLIMAALQRSRDIHRWRELTQTLEEASRGSASLLRLNEGDQGRYEDSLSKTIRELRQGRDAAEQTRRRYAENLANIAHQLKTPITALSLSVQRMRGEEALRMERQLQRMTRLEEDLLLLARLDAGVLPLQREPVDVFTLLSLAGDNLQEILDEAGIALDLPELPPVKITADLAWTMEAVLNLLRNCMEHTPAGGTIHLESEENPLYTRILIRDEGPGFAKEDLPHLFERFYRGRNAGEGGIGIGLALTRELLEQQNAVIRAYNAPEGGACYDIRFYRH